MKRVEPASREVAGVRDRNLLAAHHAQPSDFEPASSTSSGSPMRTLTERCAPSLTPTSATSAPLLERPLHDLGAELDELIDVVFDHVGTARPQPICVPPTVIEPILIVGQPTPTGTLWPSLPQVQMPSERLEVVAEHVDLAQHVGAVADQVHALERRGDLAVLDQVALGEREHEVAVARCRPDRRRTCLRVDAALDALDDLLGVVRAGEQRGVRHARHAARAGSSRGGRCRSASSLKCFALSAGRACSRRACRSRSARALRARCPRRRR